MFPTSILSLFLLLLIAAAGLAGVILLLTVGMRLVVSVLSRIFGFVTGEIGDLIILVLSIIGLFIAAPLAVFFLVLGRWGSANAQARAFGDRIARVGHAIGSVLLVRPLRLIYLDSPANAVKEALPGYMPDGAGLLEAKRLRKEKPVRTKVTETVSEDMNHFEGFDLVGSLRAGGSGARLFIAKPSEARRARLDGQPEKIVIKAFTLEQGSTLPAIIRESRALEGARRMGLVLEHHLEDERFWYVMPYHAGDQFGTVIERLHRKAGSRGLRGKSLVESMSYVRDLLQTLIRFHDAGLWHKDVKPDNLIVHDGSVHLVDLGLVTSLQSSLTLTTHGTEYFRDPELVRMALRGVKVHEVDGAKFDIFGAGAVLYFALENDFPAHGGLSDFTRPVPDALRWIVRRAMADYDKRYDSTAAMLADLDTVAAAEDPWSILPAELPSMQADGNHAVPPPPLVRTRPTRVVRSVHMPLPPRAASSPTPAMRPKRNPVPTDRPSALLLVLGVITITAIFSAVYTAVQNSPSNAAAVAREYTYRTLGTGATTMTLLSHDGKQRVLLVRDEAAHGTSSVLRQATEAVIEWYVESGFEIDRTPDLDTLAELAIRSAPIDLTSEADPKVGEVLEEHGYTSLCRVMTDSDGDGLPEMRTLDSRGNLSIIPVDPNAHQVKVLPNDAAGRIKESGWGDGDAALVSWVFKTVLEPTACPSPNIPEHDSRHSWRTASLRHRAPSTRSLHARSRMPGLMPPTSRAAHGRMSRATPTSA